MKQELTIINERKVLGKDFKVYGDFENPLFLASDVAQWIEHTDVSTMMRTVEDAEKLTQTMFVSGQRRDLWFLTEDGLYEILMQSRKPIAKQFKSEVKKILRELRTNGFVDLRKDDEIRYMNAVARQKNAECRRAEKWLKAADLCGTEISKQICAAHATYELAGEYILPLPEAPKKTYSAGEIGKMFDVSSNKIGRLANANNLKTDEYGVYVWDKSPHSAHEDRVFRYYEEAIAVFAKLLQEVA